MPGTSKSQVVNWTDIIPPPPDHPPTEMTTLPNVPINARNLSPVKCTYQAQSYQGNFSLKPLSTTSPWSTLGRNNIDTDAASIAMFGLKGHQGLIPQRTLPQGSGGGCGERLFQGSLTSLRGDQLPGLNRRVSQNGMINTGGLPFPFFLKSSDSGGDVNQIYSGIAALQDPANQMEAGEDIELNNLYNPRTSITDQTSGCNVNEENQNVRVCTNEYSNNFFIAEYNAGRAQTTLRNRCSRPPSSYSNESSTGTVPSRSGPAKQKWKETGSGENTPNDDIPSYNKPNFPTATSSTCLSQGRKRREMKGAINELSPLKNFATLSEKYGDSTSSSEKSENKEATDEKR